MFRLGRKGLVAGVAAVVIVLILLVQFYEDIEVLDNKNTTTNIRDPSLDIKRIVKTSNTNKTNLTTITTMRRLPQWMQDYFDWHVTERQRLSQNLNDWSQFPILIVRCYPGDQCGGTADRLKSLPLLVLMAAEATPRRLLLIKWGNPMELEEFLVPHLIDWSVPPELWQVTKPYRQFHNSHKITKWLQYNDESNQSIPILETRIQLPSAFYDTKQWKQSPLNQAEQITAGFSEWIFHDMFRYMFQPSPALADFINHELHQMQSTTNSNVQLIPGEYIAVHLRAKFPKEPYRLAEEQHLPQAQQLVILQQEVEHALKCGSNLMPHLPIYFAADAPQALPMARQFAANHNTNRSIFTLNSTRPSGVHLAFAKFESAAGYFPIFADLLIMGNAQCVSYGRGGFGQMASLLSYNATCHQLRRRRRGHNKECTWQD